MNYIEELSKEITEKTYNKMAPDILDKAVTDWLEILTDDDMPNPTWDDKVHNRTEVWINGGDIVLVMYKVKCPVCKRWFASLHYDDMTGAVEHCYHCDSDLEY